MNYLDFIPFYKSISAILLLWVAYILYSIWEGPKISVNKSNINKSLKTFINPTLFDTFVLKLDVIDKNLLGERLQIELLSLLAITFALILSLLLKCFAGWYWSIALAIATTLSLIFSYQFIEQEYGKIKKDLEAKIPEIGLIIKQLVALDKPISSILESLAKVKDKSIAKEFAIVYNEYLGSHMLSRSLHRLEERYPNSLIKSIIFLLEIYAEHQKNITEEIDNLIKEVESVSRIKKKIEVEFARQDKTVISLVTISGIFIFVFILINASYKEFYQSKMGISITLGVVFYEIIGISIIWFFKSLITKSPKIKRLDKKR